MLMVIFKVLAFFSENYYFDIRFKNRSTTCRAVVFPKDTEVLLGAIPMEDMDVLIDPKQEQLIVNPANPYIARKSMK